MRSVIKSFVLSALGVLAVAMPNAASAQSLDRILGLVTGASAYGYDSCAYVNRGLGQAACQTNRALNVINTVRQNEYNAQYRQRERFNRRAEQVAALQRACQAGDEQSCARSGGTDPRTMTIARELMNACTAGDKASCRRADAMLDERNIGRTQTRSAYDDGYARPVRRQDARVAQQSCRAVVDPRTGYRVAGQLVCN